MIDRAAPSCSSALRAAARGAALSSLLLATLSTSCPASEGQRAGTSLTAGARVHDGTASVTAAWSGAPEAAILAVTLDTARGARARAVARREEGAQLFGVTLFRRVAASGRDTIRLDAGRARAFFDDSLVAVTVRLLDGIAVEALTGDPTVKGGERVAGVTRLGPDELPEAWRFGAAVDSASVSVLFADGGARPGPPSGVGRGRWIVPERAERASSRLDLRLGRPDGSGPGGRR